MRIITILFLTLVCSPVTLFAQSGEGAAKWSGVISRAVPSVVSLQISYVRDFIEADQGVSSATGFVVDAERGIILTNRHVVGSGPVNITATFHNLERVDTVPLYRDPIHDFGFLRYNPADLKRNSPEALNLEPAGALVGTDIRVIGSDGGEQLSILAGTIARVDRKAPNYGRYGHNDFNTFYLQAASSTSGGSSGSPVLDQGGNVIALNAAANSNTASSFFLPLDRIKYALGKLQAGETVERGTLQTVFEHRPFRFLRRLGLTEEAEQSVYKQFPDSNGMLLVRQVFPGGAAEGLLEEGDILLSVEGQPLAEFVALAEVLDGSIGDPVTLDVLRQGQLLQVSVTVKDLDSLQPATLVELGNTVLHDISMQRARGMNLPQKGVIVAKSGYEFARAGIQSNAVITELNGKPLNSVDELLLHLNQASEGEEWILRYKVPGQEFTSDVGRVKINAKWFGARQCQRRDDARFWNCSDIPLPDTDAETLALRTPVMPAYKDKIIQSVAPALVRVSFDIPYPVDNVYATSFKGVGVVVDAERGLIVTDRNTVPIGLGDLEVTFFSAYKIPAKVVFLHPLHNIALLQYDPALLGDAFIQTPTLATEFPSLEQSLSLVGYRNDGTIRRNKIDNLSEVTLYFQTPRLSRFQQIPVDVLSASSSGPTLGGPLLDDQGVVQAVWQSFAYQEGDEIKEAEWAMPAALIHNTVQQFLTDEPYYIAPAIFEYKSMDMARELGVPDEWIARIASSEAVHRRAIYVRQVAGVGEEQLMVGDVLLAIDGHLVGSFLEIEQMFQKPVATVTVVRDGVVLEFDVRMLENNRQGTDRAVLWAGSLIQKPHFELTFQRGNDTPGVFISGTDGGSPSIQDRLYRNRYIVAVEGVPVETLDDFVEQVAIKDPADPVRLTVMAMNGYRSVVSVQPEYNFWPTVDLRYTDGNWRRRIISEDPIAARE